MCPRMNYIICKWCLLPSCFVIDFSHSLSLSFVIFSCHLSSSYCPLSSLSWSSVIVLCHRRAADVWIQPDIHSTSTVRWQEKYFPCVAIAISWASTVWEQQDLPLTLQSQHAARAILRKSLTLSALSTTGIHHCELFLSSPHPFPLIFQRLKRMFLCVYHPDLFPRLRFWDSCLENLPSIFDHASERPGEGRWIVRECYSVFACWCQFRFLSSAARCKHKCSRKLPELSLDFRYKQEENPLLRPPRAQSTVLEP